MTEEIGTFRELNLDYGDVIECVEAPFDTTLFKVGRRYEVGGYSDGWYSCYIDENYDTISKFKVISRKRDSVDSLEKELDYLKSQVREVEQKIQEATEIEKVYITDVKGGVNGPNRLFLSDGKELVLNKPTIQLNGNPYGTFVDIHASIFLQS